MTLTPALSLREREFALSPLLVGRDSVEPSVDSGCIRLDRVSPYQKS